MYHQLLRKLLPLTIGISLILSGCGLPGADKGTAGKDTAENATSMASTDPSDASLPASSDTATDQTSATPETSEATASGDEIVSIQYIRERHSAYAYNKKMTDNLAETNFDTIKLEEGTALEYPQLNDALNNLSDEECEGHRHTHKEFLKQRKRDDGQGFDYTARIDQKTYVYRSDSRVISWLTEEYDYAGGAHPFGYETGYAFDPQTGNPILLSQVIADMDGLPRLLLKKLKKEYAELVKYAGNYALNKKELKAHRDQYVNNITLEEYLAKQRDKELVIEEKYQNSELASWRKNVAKGLNWTLLPDGIRFYFGQYELGPYAAGTQQIDLSYSQEPELFQETYLKLPKAYSMDLDPEFAGDIDGDGSKDKLKAYCYTSNNGNATVKLNYNGHKKKDKQYGWNPVSRLIHTSDNRNYVYFHLDVENDYEQILIYQLKNNQIKKIDTGEKLSGYRSYSTYIDMKDMPAGALEDESMWCDYPISDPDNFFFCMHFDILISSDAQAMFRINEQGLPERKSEYYHYGDLKSQIGKYYTVQLKKPTRLQPVNQESFEAEGEPVLVKKSTYLYPYLTDGKSKLIVKDAREHYYQLDIKLSYGSYLVKLNGKKPEKLIKGLMYAG